MVYDVKDKYIKTFIIVIRNGKMTLSVSYDYTFIKKKVFIFPMNEIEVNLPQEKINFINDNHQKELHYWKNVTLKKASTENKAKELIDLGIVIRNEP